MPYNRLMDLVDTRNAFRWIVLTLLACLVSIDAGARSLAEQSATTDPPLMQPADLVRVLKSDHPKPLIIQVGFHVLYEQAHIPGSEYIGPGSKADGIRQLHERVDGLPRTQSIVLYCGCCPWNRCPNVNPAYQELRTMGFTNVNLLYIAANFGKDWVEKGYPVARGDEPGTL